MPIGIVTKIVDASAALALLFDEPAAERVRDLLAGEALAAPGLLHHEVANVCATNIRRAPAQRAIILAAFERFLRWDVVLHTVDHRQTLELAAATGLTAYDASYLWLATTLDAELVTLDRRLAAAARLPRTPG